MKNVMLLAALFFSVTAFSQTRLHDFDELLTALREGRVVKTVIDYGKCKLVVDGVEQGESINAIGGMEISNFEYFDTSVFKSKRPSFLAFSQNVLIFQNFYGYVNNYVKVRVGTDGAVEITAQYLKQRKFSARYKVVMNEKFTGKIDAGAKTEGVSFYAL